MRTSQVGKVGEFLAYKYLTNKGYKVIKKNWYCRWGEIDLVCLHPLRKLVFIEVKYSRYLHLIIPEDLFTKRKSFHLLRSINIFLNKYGLNETWHLDLVCVNGDVPNIVIKHYKDVLSD